MSTPPSEQDTPQDPAAHAAEQVRALEASWAAEQASGTRADLTRTQRRHATLIGLASSLDVWGQVIASRIPTANRLPSRLIGAWYSCVARAQRAYLTLVATVVVVECTFLALDWDAAFNVGAGVVAVVALTPAVAMAAVIRIERTPPQLS